MKRVFPIQTATSCKLKWNWSTVFLTSEETGSCHRCNHHKFDTETFDFHNTPTKLDDRARMLNGEWPATGCEYCKNIESVGGQSDRLTSLQLPGMDNPVELEIDPTATSVTPSVLEVYFDNTCNLKCLYCTPFFSSLWEAENNRFGKFFVDGELIGATKIIKKSENLEANKQKIFDWLDKNIHKLSRFNVVGGEPLYQDELENLLDVLERSPAPNLTLHIITNLNVKITRLARVLSRVKSLVDSNHIKNFEITASLDCWGKPQEYVRFPLDLERWEQNLVYVLNQHWITLVISSTVTPLTIKTLPDLLKRINSWNKVRPVYHYQNSVNGPSPFFIDMFGDIFLEDFERAIEQKLGDLPEQVASREYLRGIAKQSAQTGPNIKEINKMFHFLTEMDRRRGTNWKDVFPWLVDEFAKYNLK